VGVVAEPREVAGPLQEALFLATESRRWPIYLHGNAGVGKTSAAACVYRLWRRSLCFYWPAAKVVGDLVMARVDGTAGRIKRTIEDADLIVLDDIATREPTTAQLDALYSVLLWRENKPLVITCNYSPARLSEVMDQRIASRACRGVVIECTGKDRRLSSAMVLRA
jgi:DNA replication protein DnaC